MSTQPETKKDESKPLETVKEESKVLASSEIKSESVKPQSKTSKIQKSKVPAYKDKSKMPTSVTDRANRFFDLKQENDTLKEKMKQYDSDCKKYF